MDSIASISIPITNDEITSTLDSAQEALEETKKEQARNLTGDGKKIIDATERLIDDAKMFVNEKNPNDTLSQIISEGQQFYNEIQTNRSKWAELYKLLNNPQIGFDTSQVIKKMDSISRTAKLVSIELVASSSFRSTLYEFFSVLYTICVDASQIDKIGKPLSEVFDSLKYTGGIAVDTEKLKEAGEKAISAGLDLVDTDKQSMKLTDQQRDELWRRLKDVLNEMAKRERSQRMIHSLFEIFDMFFRPVVKVTTEISNTSDKIMNDQHIQNVMALSQQLFESFTRVKLDTLLSHCKVVYASIAEDENLSKKISELKSWIIAVVEKPEMLASEQTYKDFQKLVDDLNIAIQAKGELKHNLGVMRDEFNKIIWSLEQDPLTVAIQKDVKELVEMVLLDEKGSVCFKPEMLDQLKLIVLSSVVKRLKMPLPEICADDSNSSFAFKVNGVILGIQDILPERIIAENRGIAILNIKDKTLEKNLVSRTGYNEPTVAKATESIRIRMENINVHMPEADIWFHKKTFPEVEDSGKATIDIGGSGLDLTFVLKASLGSDNLFTLASVECDIHELSIKLSDTTHDSIYNLFISLFKGTIKRNIEEAIQESMAGVFEQMNKQMERQISSLRNSMPSILGSTH